MLAWKWPVSSVGKTSLSVRKVCGFGSIHGPVKFDTVSPTARHRCDVSSKLCWPGAQPRRWAVGADPENFGVGGCSFELD